MKVAIPYRGIIISVLKIVGKKFNIDIEITTKSFDQIIDSYTKHGLFSFSTAKALAKGIFPKSIKKLEVLANTYIAKSTPFKLIATMGESLGFLEVEEFSIAKIRLNQKYTNKVKSGFKYLKDTWNKSDNMFSFLDTAWEDTENLLI